MFSGIVETTTEVRAVARRGRCSRIEFQKPTGWKLRTGESISIDGICSTLIFASERLFAVEYMPQTLSKTMARYLKEGSIVNIERSLRYGDRIHGHFVAGHIDTVSRILESTKKGRSRHLSIATPRTVARYIVPRGSIAIQGVSLTVAKKNHRSFTVALIPHTLAATNLSRLKKGSYVNIESDMMARYGRLKSHATRGAKKIRP